GPRGGGWGWRGGVNPTRAVRIAAAADAAGAASRDRVVRDSPLPSHPGSKPPTNPTRAPTATARRTLRRVLPPLSRANASSEATRLRLKTAASRPVAAPTIRKNASAYSGGGATVALPRSDRGVSSHQQTPSAVTVASSAATAWRRDLRTF